MEQWFIRNQHLLMKLMPFNLTIIYNVGKKNINVDALSRHPQYAYFSALTLHTTLNFRDLRKALQKDPYTYDIITTIVHNLDDDHRLYYKNRLVIPNGTSLRTKLLWECHDSLTARHGGYLKRSNDCDTI